MKKILFMGGLTSGGAEHQMVIIARLLKIKGYDVSYLTGGKSDYYRDALEEARIPIIQLKDNRIINILRLNTPYITWQIRSILQQGKYDTVISFLGFWNYENCLFANKRSTKHRAITGIRNNRDELWLTWREKFYTRYESNAAYKVSNSEFASKRFGAVFPYVADKLMTIYNIVDLPSITTEYKMRAGGTTHIIVPASYRSVKNPMGMLNALVLMGDKNKKRIHIDWYGNIRGGQACYNEMMSFIKEHKLEEIVSLYDATKDIANRINEADFIGLFSTSEGLPNAVCEGMMLGKPVIMTRVSDYKVLAGSGNGILCDADDSQTIKMAFEKIVNLADEDIRSMGELSQKIANNLFTAEVVLKQWEKII